MTSLPAIPKALAALNREALRDWQAHERRRYQRQRAWEQLPADRKEWASERLLTFARQAPRLRALAAPTPYQATHLSGLTGDWAAAIESFRRPGVYGDVGQWDFLHAKMTDSDWPLAVASMTRGLDFLVEQKGVNNVMITGSFFGWAAGELEPHMTAEQKAHWRTQISAWRDYALATNRLGDSDANVGYYFALRHFAKFLGDDWQAYTLSSGPGGPPCTMDDLWAHVEACIKQSTGGEWVEGSEYNHMTLTWLMLGAKLLGEDLPGVKELAHEAVEQTAWMLTTDGKHYVNWGDTETPDFGGRRQAYMLTALATCHAVGGNPKALDLLATHMLRPDQYHYAFPWLVLCLDPRDLPAAPVKHNPQGLRKTGVGLVLWRSGDWLVPMHQPPKGQWWEHDAQYGVAAVQVFDGQKWRLKNQWGFIPATLGHNTARAGGLPNNEHSVLANYFDRILDTAETTTKGFRLVGRMGGYPRSWGSWFPEPFLKHPTDATEGGHLTRVIEWDEAAKSLTVTDSTEFSRQPPSTVEEAQAQGFTYSMEYLSVVGRKALVEQVWQAGEYTLTTDAPGRLDEEGRVRLLSDAYPAVSIKTTLVFAELPPTEPPPVEPPSEPPPGGEYTELDPDQFTVPLSFEAWFDGEGVILGQVGGAAQPPAVPASGYVPLVHLGTDRRLRTSLVWHGSTAARLVSEPLDAGQHHVAVTYDGTTETLYIDGEKFAEQQAAKVEYADAYRYFLGAGYTATWEGGNGGWHYFAGTIEGAKVHPGVLTAEQVQASFAAGPGVEPPPTEPPPEDPPPTEPPTETQLDRIEAKLDRLLKQTYKVTPNAP